MKRPKSRNYKTIHIYVTKEEYMDAVNACAKTTSQSLSQYARKLIFGKPVTVYFRNQSFDQFVEYYIRFKKDLDTVMAKRCFGAIDRELMLQEIKAVKAIVNQIVRQCSQK